MIELVSTHVVFTGGGTGGHLFPGLAVAQRLVEDAPHVRITFAGSGKQFEREQVSAAGFEYLPVRCRRLPRRLREGFSFVADNLAGYRTARRFLGEHRVAAVVGLGGYASVPMAVAAVRRNVPLVLLEQNAAPGRATRWLAPSATLVCTAFEEAGRYLNPRRSVRVTGNPIRNGFTPRPAARDTSAENDNGHHQTSTGQSNQLLVLGGSGGARSFNQNVPRALGRLGESLTGWEIVHQSGEAELEATRRHYHELGLEATVLPFVRDMPRMLARSELAICRAGGTTLAELAAAGLPAVLLPYPHATDDHQRKNADVFAASGGCLTLDEREIPGRLEISLVETVAELLTGPAKRIAMSRAIHRLARPDAARDVAAMIRHLVT